MLAQLHAPTTSSAVVPMQDTECCPSAHPVDLYDIWPLMGFRSYAVAKRYLLNNFRPGIDFSSTWHVASVETSAKPRRMRIFKLSIPCARAIAMQSPTDEGRQLTERLTPVVDSRLDLQAKAALFQANTCSEVLAGILRNLAEPMTTIALTLRLRELCRDPRLAHRAETYSAILEDEARKLLDLFHEIGRLHETISEDRLALLSSYQLLRS